MNFAKDSPRAIVYRGRRINQATGYVINRFSVLCDLCRRMFVKQNLSHTRRAISGLKPLASQLATRRERTLNDRSQTPQSLKLRLCTYHRHRDSKLQ